MRIGYVLNNYPMPSQTFIRREIAALEAMGTEVRRYSLRQSAGPLPDHDDQREVERTRVVLGGASRLVWAVVLVALASPLVLVNAVRQTMSLAHKGTRTAIVHLVYLAEACVLLRWLREDGVTHVHSHFGTNAAEVALLCRTLGGPQFSFTVHGPEEFDRPEALKLRAKIEVAEFVVTISDHGRSQLFRWSSHAHWQKIHVIRCGVDAAYLESEPSPVPVDGGLVCIGRLEEQKGQLLLVEAARRVVADGGSLDLTLIGDGVMRDEIAALIRRHALDDHVRLVGWMDSHQIRQQIQEARATVLASFAEGLPVVIMESLALGRPVVTTHVAGVPELVADGVNGWLVPPGSVDALASALGQVSDAPDDVLTDMGVAGRAAVRERHDVRIEASRLRLLFENAHHGERPHPQGGDVSAES